MMRQRSLRLLLGAGLASVAAHAALAHVYNVGDLEIHHPVIMVPTAQSDCSCAHVKIVNRGTKAVYFLGADIAVARRTHLIAVSTGGAGLSMPLRVEIGPGETLDLDHHHWCLFMSGITATLEANVGAIAGTLNFENQGPIAVEFVVDAPAH
jgi:copper(I)-binding protein